MQVGHVPCDNAVQHIISTIEFDQRHYYIYGGITCVVYQQLQDE